MDMRGSGSLSHVYLEHPPLWCSIPETRGLFYDDANKLLLSPTSDQVLCWKIGPSIQHDPPTSDSISDGPVLSIRFSLDGKLIGILRSNCEIQFKNRATGEIFCRKYKPESDVVLGFFWTDCPVCDIVVVKTSGLDLLSYEPGQNTLRLVETKRFNVSWYVYTHESRLILLASGAQCKLMTGFQLSSGGIVRLPKFEMILTKTDANPKPVLSQDDVHIVVLYGRIYCFQLDRLGGQLQLHRFYRDAVIHQGFIPIYSSKVAVSVVDNVVLVHQVEAKVVILYDLFLDSLAPISAPLPLLLRRTKVTSSSNGKAKSSADMDGRSPSGYEGTIYGNMWNFLVPDLVCDVDHGLLWKLRLDLEAIATSSSDVPFVFEFLQRRRSDPAKIKQLCLGMMRSSILERRPVPFISRATDVLAATYSQHRKMDRSSSAAASSGTADGSAQPEGVDQDLQASAGVEAAEVNAPTVPSLVSDSSSSAGVSPEEMCHHVFAVVEEEMGGDLPYLVSVIVEYLRSISSEKLSVPSDLHVMIVQLLGRSGRHADLFHFITAKIVESSKSVAFQLIDMGRDHPQTRKLGIDMLRRLSLHHDYVLMLVNDGYYLEAMRYARKNKVTTVHPASFLEAVVNGGGGSLHLTAALRFFSDFIPGFKGTLDDGKFRQMLSLMS
ncbi:C18orf8 [Wolffia australiana]